MKLTFHGAAGEVTGSAYHLVSGRANLLVDCGMFQGNAATEKQNRIPRNLPASNLDAVLLTHAHLDHCGRLPLLVKRGFDAPVFCTPATIDLARLILTDSAKVQAHDAARTNRKRQRAGLKPVEPLYNAADVDNTMRLFQSVPYNQPVDVAPGVQARYVEAGHMLGSSSIEVAVQENGRRQTLVFSGDIGPSGAPILKDAVPFDHADVVIQESTYGDRDHRRIEETIAEFESVVKEAVGRGGKILVPTFAVGRAQLILYVLAVMFRNGGIPKFPVFVDSPMAIEANQIYLKHPELFDEELKALRLVKPLVDDLDTVQLTESAEQSKAINDVAGPCLILAGAGMCNAGRILHHLKQNLWKSDTSVLIVGYQSEGSLGRLLVEGRKHVKIFGEKIAVKAAIHTLGGFSAHAGQTELSQWLGALAGSKPRVILTHGEDRARKPYAKLIKERHGLNADLPGMLDTIEL